MCSKYQSFIVLLLLCCILDRSVAIKSIQTLIAPDHAPHHDGSDFVWKNTEKLVSIRGGDAAAAVAEETFHFGRYVHSFLSALDIFGTGVFAFSGALTAGKKGMDIIGMIIIACVTSVGGGTVRDIVLGKSAEGGVFWMKTPLYIEICISVTLATFVIWPKLEKIGCKDSAKIVCTADALGLAAFVVIGTQEAAKRGFAPSLWVVSGMTAVFGGIMRDVICGEPPRVMYPYRTMYGAGPAFGSIIYTLLSLNTRIETDFIAAIAFLVVFVVRILSFNVPYRLPHWRDDDNN